MAGLLELELGQGEEPPKSNLKQGLLDSINAGVVAPFFGWPGSLAEMFMRPFGYKGTVFGSAEDLTRKMQAAGIIKERNPTAELIAGLVVPPAMNVAGRGLFTAASALEDAYPAMSRAMPGLFPQTAATPSYTWIGGKNPRAVHPGLMTRFDDARDMLAAGADENALRQRLNTVPIPGSGQLATRIPDSGMSLPDWKNPELPGGMPKLAHEYISHPLLFQAVPNVQNTKILVNPAGTGFSFSPGSSKAPNAIPGTINIPEDFRKMGRDRVTSGILHELNHAVQLETGLPRGANVDSFMPSPNWETAMKYSQGKWHNALDKYNVPNDPKLIESWTDLIKRSMTGGMLTQQERAKVASLPPDLHEAWREILAMEWSVRKGFRKYQTEAGEQLATNAQRTMQLTDAELRATPHRSGTEFGWGAPEREWWVQKPVNDRGVEPDLRRLPAAKNR